MERFMRKKTGDKPKLLQSIHQQWFDRLYNLDYLQWLQRNAKTQIAGMALLVILLSMTIYTLPRQQDLQIDIAREDEMASVTLQEELAEEEKRIEEAQEELLSEKQPENQPAFQESVITERKSAETEDKARDLTATEPLTVTEEKEEERYINPFALNGYVPPVDGTLQYEYGLGYDAVYEDYRFHTDVSYLAENGEVFACVSGVITEVQPTQQWQISIQCEDGTVRYAGMDTCVVQPGDSVIAGQKIGTADSCVSRQALEK